MTKISDISEVKLSDISGFIDNYKRAGYVYILKADTGQYKVGRSKNVPQRMKMFAVQLPFDFDLLWSFPCSDMYEAESVLHDACKNHGYHVRGEWFDLPDEYLDSLLMIDYFILGKYYVPRFKIVQNAEVSARPQMRR